MDNNKYTRIFCNTREKIRERILGDKRALERYSKNDAAHSAAYYFSLFRLFDEFIKKLDDTILFENLEPNWEYAYSISYEGASLYIEHLTQLVDGTEDSPPVYDHDQNFMLFEVSARFLTVEEYAKQYGTSETTVRQWIRRAKIRTAKKYGNEWRISELTDPPRRGYEEGMYIWEEPLSFLPDEFSFLKGYCEATISQCMDKKKFKIQLRKPGNVIFYDKVEEMTASERERLEMYLIGNPEIHYVQRFNEAPVWDLHKRYSNIYDAREGL